MKNADLRKAYMDNCKAARDHYTQYGQNEGRDAAYDSNLQLSFIALIAIVILVVMIILEKRLVRIAMLQRSTTMSMVFLKI